MFKAIFLHRLFDRRSLGVGSIWLLLATFLLVLSGCAASTPSVETPEQRAVAPGTSVPGRAEELFVVDCLLPGQVRKLGRMTFLTPRRPIKTTAQDCEIRGGEYVAYDRADYRTALNVWLPQAQAGDKEAQTYAGEIYEKGLGLSPDYATAMAWYRKAAEQGHTRAQINLGHLYEKGLGVEKDPAQALFWYRKASGLNEAVTLDAGSLTVPGPGSQEPAELQALRQEVKRLQGTAATLRQQLERTQQQRENIQQELEQRQHTAATERQQLAQARQELAQRQQLSDAAARDDSELKRLEAQLQQREAELARQQQEVVRLQQEKAQWEQEAGQHRAQLAALEQRQQVELAGPTIEVVEPPVTRGAHNLAVVTVSNGTAGLRREIVGKVTSPAGVLTFTVNDQPEKLNEHGIFRVPISVKGAGVPIKLVAVDQQGKRASIEFTLTPDAGRSSAGLAPKRQAPAIEFGTYHALIIGNNAYANWPNLETPQNDAVEMAALLDKKYGFTTKVLLNATRFDILQTLNELRKTLTEADNLLVYYAGHGHYEKKIERGYWVPIDGHMDSDVNWISTFAITDILSVISARHVLVVSDSCYSGALTRSALARLEEGMTEQAREHWLRAIAAKRSRTVLASGSLQPVLDTGGGGHSVFAKAFLDVLTSNTDILEGQRLGSEVAARVSYAASAALVEQDPQYAPLRYAGHELGDFLFVPKALQ